MPLDLLAPPLPAPAAMAVALGVVGFAGVVRGFAGFGFSAISVAGLSLLVSPARIVPAIFVLEVLASLSLLRGALPAVDWRWLSWLVLGNAACIPLGVALLALLPETPLRLLIAGLLFTAAALLRAGVRVGLAPTRGVRLATGLVSGFVNGVAAIGGIAVAVLLSTAGLAPAAMRATMIVLFLFTDLWALASAALLTGRSEGTAALLGADTVRWALWLLPAMLVGIWIGQRGFRNVTPERFRTMVLNLLLAVSVLAGVQALR